MHIDFEKNGYLVVREFFDSTTISLMQTYWDIIFKEIQYDEKVRSQVEHSEKMGNVLTKEDVDVGFSYNFYSDKLMESIELNYGAKACKILQMRLSPTYTFTRIYEKGSPLIPHRDRPSCEVSATCPILISDDRPSTIYISSFKWWNITDQYPPQKFSLEEIKTKGDYSEVNLYPGDLVFYRGCERYHWREPLESDYLIQFFMHFVEADGEHKELVFDARPYMGFSNETKQF